MGLSDFCDMRDLEVSIACVVHDHGVLDERVLQRAYRRRAPRRTNGAARLHSWGEAYRTNNEQVNGEFCKDG